MTDVTTMPRMGRKRRPAPRGTRTLRQRFARRLHELAGDKSNKEIAEKLDVADQAVGAWLRGETIPEMNLWPRLAKALGCRVEDFFRGC